jgi:dolichyl-diphosphooligosaccharide--protein glycosyltransferase
MALILAIAFLVRLLPVRWGYYLNEFDPYYQFRQTEYIVKNGLLGANGWISWHDYLSWYPWGNVIRYASYPGLPALAATLFMTLNTLGVSFTSFPTLDPLLSNPIYVFCVIFPTVMATLASLAIYFLGKDLGGEPVGMFAALFLALDSSYISRTALGFFDDESVGILSLILFCLFFLRSIEKEKPSKMRLLYAIAAGFTLAYLSASWGAARYPIVMTALFALCLLMIGRYSTRLFISYLIVFAIALPIAANVPRLGTSFIMGTEVLPVYGVLFFLCISEIKQRLKTRKIFYYLSLTCLFVVLLAFLWERGYISSFGTKFMAVLNPFARFESTIFESVAEHRPSAWGTFYYNWGVGTFFLPVGLFFAVISATDPCIFMVIFGLTSMYFASSLIRITVMVSPIISLLWALALVRLMKPFILFLREPSDASKRKTRFRGVIGKETAAGIIILMFVFLNLTYVIGTDFMVPPSSRIGPRVFSQAYSPTTIAAAGMSVGHVSATVRDWLDALSWMRENLPPSPESPGMNGTVIASWWDYGYWITTMANRTSLADNGSWNLTQIQQIGLMFMSNETEAVKILRNYNVTHVVVFVTFEKTYGSFVQLGGDNAKWQWMAKIPGLNDADFGNFTLGYDWYDVNGDGTYYDSSGYVDTNEIFSNSLGQNSTLFRLMSYGRDMTMRTYSSITLQYFEEAYFSQKHGSPSAAKGTSYVPLVCVYEVKYPTE